ncbi:MAG: DNA-binding response regulator [Burkholderiales bacterium RIFCSPLOWO2_12_FULL_64_99]|jgi:two-component system nitrate/nitrite response regulator NarL|uniref:response regulator n=1 Tax=Aquabacterium sp. TaxID=1872578 RepID=UPI0008B54DE4|nr:response regulator [Aquabacterium sp.]OGB05193.1 MAG: DNA-binding response regulator [Burkholderiales bacterium RIFCSPHIGHO2_12_FULL_63_20]OGB60693.1 MAG: DNA-binding response regulator [Burkholderiales bacterium RIFCSPLOWO2_12_FULL_64_99]
MTDPQPVRLMVVDDHNLFRRGLIALLSRDPRVQVVAEARDAGEALKLGAQHQPDVILLDNHLPGVHGVEALPQLCATVPQARIVMLTVSEDANDLAQALARGAAGYLLKTVEGDELVEAVLRARQGESVLSPEMTGKLMAAYRDVVNHASPILESAPSALVADVLGQGGAQGNPAPDRPKDEPVVPVSRLSPRENDILREIARGASNKEIARTLQIAETTVKIHVQHILRKLNLTSRVQAAVFAVTDPHQG